MHNADFNFSLKEISKIEGSANLDIAVSAGKVSNVAFRITEYKRFYTQAIRGKNALSAPQLLARICGTCSNAHILCAIEAVEKALGVQPTVQSKILKRLVMYGLMIRDHALHLYVFSLPDIFEKDSLFDFDENDPVQHELLHDTFQVKEAGNALSKLIGGRSVHAPFPAVGGFSTVPEENMLNETIEKLKKARPAVLRLIDVFAKAKFEFISKTQYVCLKSDVLDFLEGNIVTSDGETISESDFYHHLEHKVIPYSQASGYAWEGETYMVGALARLNLVRKILNEKTQKDAQKALARFPSTNVFDNNLAQAIEILHCLDSSLDILGKVKFQKEEIVPPVRNDGVGIGVIEAPRGLLYHKLEIEKGNVKNAEIVVPTGQNQIKIEKDIGRLVQANLSRHPERAKRAEGSHFRKELIFEIEKLIRAYDPCMSCAAHFLKIKWR